MTTEVANNTGEDYYLDEFSIIIKDSDEKILTILPGYVGELIPNGEVRTIESNTLTKIGKIKW